MSKSKGIQLDNLSERCSFFIAGITKVSVVSSVTEQISKLSEDQAVAKKEGLLGATKENEELKISEISFTFPGQNEAFSLVKEDNTEAKKWWGIFSHGDHPNEKDVELLKMFINEPFLLLKHSSPNGPPVMSMYEVIYDREKEVMSFYELVSFDPERTIFYIRGNAPLSGAASSDLLENIPENSPLQEVKQMYLNYENFQKALEHGEPVCLPDRRNFRQKFTAKSGGNVNCRKYFWHVARQNNFPLFIDYNFWIHRMKWVIRWWNGSCSTAVNQGDEAEKTYEELIRWEEGSWESKRIYYSRPVRPCTHMDVAKLKLDDESYKKGRCSFYMAGISKVSVAPSVIEQILKISEDEAVTEKGGVLRARKQNDKLEIFEASSSFPDHQEAFSPGDKFENKKWWGIFSHGEHPNENDVEILKTFISEPFLLLKHSSSDGSPFLLVYEVIYNKEKEIMSFYELVSFDPEKTCFYVRGNAPLSGHTFTTMSDLLENIQENSPLQKIKEMYQNYEDFQMALQSGRPRPLPTLEEFYEKLANGSAQVEKDFNVRRYFRRLIHEEHFSPILDYSLRMKSKMWDCYWWHNKYRNPSAGGNDAGKACETLMYITFAIWKSKTAPYPQ